MVLENLTKTHLDGAPGPWVRRRVAILLFNDVEVLDFAGPFEVFGVAKSLGGQAAFEVMTVALHPGVVVARNDLRVFPSHTASLLGSIDVLVIPGGFGTRREMRNPRMLDFIRRMSASAEITLSICTGALMLGMAGLLKGHIVTTHWAAMDELRSLDSGGRIRAGARVIDNGSLVVCAGVSAGIDGALHIVERVLGRGQAEAAARDMEYDWNFRHVELTTDPEDQD